MPVVLPGGMCEKSTAKRLKELGVKQDSLYVWSDSLMNEFILRSHPGITGEYYSAFTVPELVEHFPSFIQDREPGFEDNYRALGISILEKMSGRRYTAGYMCIDEYFTRSSLANACAELLIWLIEEKYISV